VSKKAQTHPILTYHQLASSFTAPLNKEEEREQQREELGSPQHQTPSPSRSSPIPRRPCRLRRRGRSSTRRPGRGGATTTANATSGRARAGRRRVSVGFFVRAGRRRGSAGFFVCAGGRWSPRARCPRRVALAKALEGEDGAVSRGSGGRLGPRGTRGGEVVYFRVEGGCAIGGGVAGNC
jgi:hypothetical protein